MSNAISSYMSLCGNEIINAARMKAYIDHGVKPTQFDIRVPGCDGLDAIVAAVGEPAPVGGYHLPELDEAPWYDVAIPESQNFAGLLVTEVTISAPYSRSTTGNIGTGQTLGRLKLQGRSIVIKGWLVGRTCCATGYGLNWLTHALGGTPCLGVNCGGCTMEFLDCCPVIGEGEGDFLETDGGIYVRPGPDDEYARATDFFRRTNGAGVTDGPNVISQKGASCGCGGSPLLEVEFTMATSSPYFSTFGLPIISDYPVGGLCDPEPPCNFDWLKVPYGEPVPQFDPECPPPVDCLEDPSCPPPAIPPPIKMPFNKCACLPMQSTRIMAESNSDMKWRTSTLNIDVFSGSAKLKNLVIRMWRNPDGLECDDESFLDCNAVSSLIIGYIPPNAHLLLSGEDRTVTITCDGNQRNAAQNVTGVDGQPFEWPDLNCGNVCIHADFDCKVTALDATLSITRIDRDL